MDCPQQQPPQTIVYPQSTSNKLSNEFYELTKRSVEENVEKAAQQRRDANKPLHDSMEKLAEILLNSNKLFAGYCTTSQYDQRQKNYEEIIKNLDNLQQQCDSISNKFEDKNAKIIVQIEQLQEEVTKSDAEAQSKFVELTSHLTAQKQELNKNFFDYNKMIQDTINTQSAKHQNNYENIIKELGIFQQQYVLKLEQLQQEVTKSDAKTQSKFEDVIITLKELKELQVQQTRLLFVISSGAILAFFIWLSSCSRR
ncbi:MAG TPA: hypothetical protein VLB80_05020 [Candidatus Babeliales bacterium]|nr:hypothetical protein [Candidatus Babeliales bacterium]